jgi:phenylalanyl-tRNA synthetase beta subunit
MSSQGHQPFVIDDLSSGSKANIPADVRLFEIGRHYRFAVSKKSADSALAPVETVFLTLGATGEARAQGLYDSARAFTFADLKGDLEAIGALSGGIQWKDGGPDSLHPTRRGRILLGENELGSAGQLHRRLADKTGAGQSKPGSRGV